MFHMEHAKNQKSAKIEICGFFLCDLTKIYFWRGGASSSITTIIYGVARKRVTNLLQKVIVYILARGRQ